MIQAHFPEVLAPVGDFERLRMALLYGADAVYLGSTEYGMRSASANFDMDSLRQAVKMAHEKNVRVYLTCNTLPRNDEIDRMEDFIRQAADLRHNLTIEILIMQALKLFLSEGLLLNGLPLMRELFIFAGALAWTGGGIFFPSIPTPEEISIGTILLYWVLGLFYCLAAMVGGFVILCTVYKRYINLFVLVIFCPVAIAWLPGDVHTTLAWVKSFLGSVFEIVVIAWVLALVSLMLNNGAIVFSSLEGTPAEPFVAMLEGLLMMLISSGCVKGAESLLRRSFHL